MASALLNTIIQANIVILTVTGTFLTFSIAFTRREGLKARELEYKKRQLERRGVAGLRPIAEDCYAGFRDVYASCFSDPARVRRFFGELVSCHRHPGGEEKNWNTVMFLLHYPIMGSRIMRAVRYKDGIGGERWTVVSFSGRVDYERFMAEVLWIARGIDARWRSERKGSGIPSVSPLFSLLARVRTSLSICAVLDKAGFPPQEMVRRVVRQWPWMKMRKAVTEWTTLVMLEGKEDILMEQIKDDLIEWGALHELASMFPAELLFPTEIATPPSARALGCPRVEAYCKADQRAFEAAKQKCLASEPRAEISSIKRGHGREQRDFAKRARQIAEAGQEISRLFFFFRPEGRRVIKRLVTVLTGFSVATILWSLLAMGSISSTHAVGASVSLAMALFVVVIVSLVTIIAIFTRSL